jgi:hypothetical protein
MTDTLLLADVYLHTLDACTSHAAAASRFLATPPTFLLPLACCRAAAVGRVHSLSPGQLNVLVLGGINACVTEGELPEGFRYDMDVRRSSSSGGGGGVQQAQALYSAV